MKRLPLRLLAVIIICLCFCAFVDAPNPHPFKDPGQVVNLNGPRKDNIIFYPMNLKENFTGFRRMPVGHSANNMSRPSAAPLLKTQKWVGIAATSIILAGAELHIPCGAMSSAAADDSHRSRSTPVRGRFRRTRLSP